MKDPDLEQLIEDWLALPRGTREEREAAENFYEERIFPITVPLVVNRTPDALRDANYDLLILTLGTSPAPIALSILAVQPQNALLLCTEQSRALVRKIQGWVSDHGGKTGVSFERVEPSDPLTVYRAVREHKERNHYQRIAVDATGGTKAMVSGAAQAAGVLGADLLYVDNTEYLPELRRPKPGTEFVARLANPYEVFGDLREREALRLAAQHQYARAADVLEALPDTTQAHLRYELLTKIMHGYGQLEAMNFAGVKVRNPARTSASASEPSELVIKGGAAWLAEAADLVHRALEERTVLPLGHEELQRLRAQADWAKKLGEALAEERTEPRSSDPPALLADAELTQALWSFLFNYAARRAACAQYDAAALCLYRCLELVVQRRLALRGINASAPDYAKLGDPAELEQAYAEAKIGKIAGGTLPAEISLLNGLRLLLALEDGLVTPRDDSFLQKTQGLVESRNRSIFAHGLQRLDPGTYQHFRDAVAEWGRRLCAVEGWDGAWMRKLFEFLDFGALAAKV